MKMEELNYYYNKFKFGEDIFHQLMQKRVRDILLVSTFYEHLSLNRMADFRSKSLVNTGS